jgi:hypothetical protein
MRHARGLVALVLSAAAGTVWGAPLDFKGLVIGVAVTRQEVEERLGSVRCGDGADGVTVCNGTTSVAGYFAQANIVINPKGVLQRVLLDVDADYFDVIADELQKKFGKPQRRGGTVQNGFGAQFPQVDLTWQDGKGGFINYRRYAGSTDTSMLYFGTAEDRRVWATPAKSGDL